MSDIWQWIDDRRYDALRRGDETAMEMVAMLWRMLDIMEDNPQLGLHYGAQARQIAELIGDKWFIQLMNHWELQARFSFLGDYNGTLELATKSAVEVRLPEYQDFPQRICLHEDLISAYAEQDPIGNRELVQQALDYMEQEVDPNVECYMCLNGLKLDFVMTTGTHDEVRKTAQSAIKVAESSPHHLGYIYLMLVESAYQQKDWENLLIWAIEAESNARKAERENRTATALLWLALHAQRTDELERARSLYQQGTHRADRYGAFIGRPYYVALTAYHETGGTIARCSGSATNISLPYR